MAIDFPDSPSVDNTYTVGNRTWTWDGSAWNLSSTANNGINLAIASSAPTSAIEGDLWYDTTSGLFYMYYSSVWTQVGGAFDTSIVQDTDQDTYIDTEATTDEDVIRIYTGGTQRLSIGASAIVPETTEVYDLGSSSNRFKDLYLSGTSIDLGGVTLSSDGTNLSVTPSGGAPADPVATESYVDTAITDLVGGAPLALDTLNELAAALNDDESYATTITNALAGKLNISGGSITGDLTVDTNVFHVDSTNNRVGVNTATPTHDLHVVGDITLTSKRTGEASHLPYTNGNNYLTAEQNGTHVFRNLDAGNSLVTQATIEADGSLDVAGNLKRSGVDIDTLPPNDITGNYTLVLSDAGTWIAQSGAGGRTLTIPPNSSVAFPIGTQILVSRSTTGTVTISQGSGVSLYSVIGGASPGNWSIANINGFVTLIKYATNTWYAVGDVS